jgi:hypothetical protein
VLRPAKRPHHEGGASAGGGGGGGGDGGQYRDVSEIDSDEDYDDGGVLEWFDLPADSADVVEGVADTKTDAELMELVRQLDSAAVGATAARPSASASAAAGGGGGAGAPVAAAAPPSAAAFYAGSNAAREQEQRAERSRVAARKAKDKAADEKLADSENTIWRADGDLVDYEPPNCVCTEALPTNADYSDPTRFGRPVNFLDLFFDSHVYALLLANTNAFRRSSSNPNRADYEMTEADLRAMLGTLLAMGAAPMDDLNRYWRTDGNGLEFVRSKWSRNHFKDLFGSLRVRVDPKPTDSLATRMWDIDPFVAAMNERFAGAIVPGDTIVVDETMVRYRGQHPSVQLMPKKPIRVGFKLWTLSTSAGYVLRQTPYCGRPDSGAADGLTARVVKELVAPYLNGDGGGQQRRVIMDMFYTAIPLTKELHSQEMLVIGSMDSRRVHYPRDLRTIDLDRDTFAVRQAKLNPALIAVAAQFGDEKAPRHFISTATAVPVESTTIRTKTGANVDVPSVMAQYNALMGGVDTANRFAAKNTVWRKAKRWWLCVFLHYFHVACVNAFLLYTQFGRTDKRLNFTQFCDALSQELTEGFVTGRKRMGRPPKRLSGVHNLTRSTDIISNGKAGDHARKRGRCSVCCERTRAGAVGKRVQTGKWTAWRCRECAVWVCGIESACWKAHCDGRTLKR